MERRSGDRDWVAFVITGGIVLGLVTAVVGPVGGWDGEGWLARVAFTALGMISGALLGWRLWASTGRD